MNRFAIATSLLVLLIAVATVSPVAAAEGDAPVATEKPKPVMRSLLQACRKETLAHCQNRRGDTVKCLVEHESEFDAESQCVVWLSARKSCNTWLSENNKCPASSKADPNQYSMRACLRNIPVDQLPETCSKTDYFKSVKLFGAYRKAHKTIH